MPPDDKQKVEIEVAIRDGFSTVLKELGRQLGSVNKQAQEIGVGPSNSYNKFRRENDQLSESAKRSNAQFATMGAIFTDIGRSLIGPIGVVAGLYTAAKALDTFASGRIQMRNLSTDLHLTTGQLSIMQRTLANMGMSTQESTQVISNAMGKIKEAFTLRLGSSLMSDLREMGEGEWATKLQKVIDTGDFARAWDMMLDKGNTGTARFKAWFAERMGVPESVIQSYKRNSEGVEAMTEADIATLENYHKKMNLITNKIEDAWHKVAISVIDAIKTMNNSKIADILRDENITDPAQVKESIQERLGKFGVGIKSDKYPQGQDPMGRDYLRRERGGYNPGFGGSGSDRLRGSRGEDAFEVQNDSNKTLRDIRDTLQRMESGITVGGGGGGSSDGLSGVRGGNPNSPSSQILQRPGGPQLPSSLGGPGGPLGPGGSGGIAAPAGTPISRSGMATVTSASGKTFQVDARFKDNFQGFLKDWEGAGGVVGPSSGSLGMRPGNASGHPIGTAMDINQIGRGIRSRNSINPAPEVEDALAQKWGLVSGNQWRSNDQGHFGVKSVQAARDALVKQGMMPSEAERSVKGSYFTDQRTASGQDASKVPGIALPSRSGLGKMYEVTGPDGKKMMLPQIDVGPAGWTGRGIDLSGPAADAMGYGRKNFPTDQSFSYRQMIDKSQSSGGGPSNLGTANVDVDFKNMPSWVKTNVDANGAFKKLSVTRSAPQNAKAGDGISSSSPWSYE